MKCLVLLLLLAGTALPDEPKPFDVEKFLARHPMVDGNVNVYSPKTKVGQPDFARGGKEKSVRALTGIAFGSMTCGSLKSLEAQAKNATAVWKGVRLVRQRSDLDACLKDGQYGLLLYCQTPYALKGRIEPVAEWHKAGLRVLNLQYGSKDGNQSKEERLAGGSDQTGGLTELGRRVVTEMLRVGIVVDVSHCNEQTVLDTVAIAARRKLPVLANHTCAREIRDKDGVKFADYRRNMTDRAMRAIRDTDGVIGIMAYYPYLRRVGGSGNADDLVRHVVHAVKVAGIDHVGLSTDGYLDGTMARNRTCDGVLDSPGRWKRILEKLHARGFDEKALAKLAGGNFLRAYRRVLR